MSSPSSLFGPELRTLQLVEVRSVESPAQAGSDLLDYIKKMLNPWHPLNPLKTWNFCILCLPYFEEGSWSPAFDQGSTRSESSRRLDGPGAPSSFGWSGLLTQFEPQNWQ